MQKELYTYSFILLSIEKKNEEKKYFILSSLIRNILFTIH